MLTCPEESVASIAWLLGASRGTLYKHIPELGKSQLTTGEDTCLRPDTNKYDDLLPSRSD